MKLSFFQSDIHHGFPQRNLEDLTAALDRHVEQGGGIGDLLVLPELFTSGYIFDHEDLLRPLAESISDSPSVSRLIEAARRHDTSLVAGLPELDGKEIFNTAVIVNSEGLVAAYRKQKLSVIDQRYFTAGQGITCFEVGGIRVGVLVCFDIWFPEIARAYLADRVDLIVHLANFGGPQTLDIARSRALENSLPILTCNRLGSERLTLESSERRHTVNASYRGESQLVDHDGTVLYRAGSRPELKTLEIEIDPERRKQVLGNDLLSLLDL